MREALFAAVVLICPLMMLWMMRGGHGHGAHGHGGHSRPQHDHDLDDAHAQLTRKRSTRGLHELRDEIDRLIEERERAEHEHGEADMVAGSRK